MLSELKEAKSAYVQCLKIDEKSVNTMKDLSVVQLTLMDWAGLTDTRLKFMLEQPQIVHWASYLFALYMSKNYDVAFEAIESMHALLQNEVTIANKYQISELHLFGAHMHHAKGDLDRAIKVLEKKSKKIVDHVRLNQMLSQFYLEANKHEKA